jgi:hypothetical protein
VANAEQDSATEAILFLNRLGYKKEIPDIYIKLEKMRLEKEKK